jgi:hypothetical protein
VVFLIYVLLIILKLHLKENYLFIEILLYSLVVSQPMVVVVRHLFFLNKILSLSFVYETYYY